ncbi:S-layer homology domain-containing protein [Candidatus Peregrinibacteria bacterium]|nr:S-layer homology domain-containing protein [Candidatus Peregrinibacteria bacterium]
MSRLPLICASLLAILLLILTANYTSHWNAAINLPFSDIDQKSLAGHATLYFAHRDFLQGFPDGTFRGSSIVNRAEAAKLLVLAAGLSFNEDLPNPFSDVPQSEWFTPFVLAAREKGILDGYPDGSFRPARGITTAEFIKMATNAFELPLSLPHRFTDFHAGSWFTPFAGTAWHYHLFPERLNTNVLLPEELLSRNDMIVALYQIATFGTKAHFIDPDWNLRQDRTDILRSRGQFHAGGKSLPSPHLTGGILPGTGGVVPGT